MFLYERELLCLFDLEHIVEVRDDVNRKEEGQQRKDKACNVINIGY